MVCLYVYKTNQQIKLIIMTSKEKAEDLILKHSLLPEGNNKLVKELALITVNEILYIHLRYNIKATLKFWSDVKEEIITFK